MTSVSVPHLLKPCTIYFPFGPQAMFPCDGDEQNETASGHRVKVLSRPNGISARGVLTLSFSQVKSSKMTAFPPLTRAAGSDLSHQAQIGLCWEAWGGRCAAFLQPALLGFNV